MNQELVEVTDSIDTFDAFYKVQHIKLLDLPIELNDNPASPFFIKASLDFDKYELPTILPFEEFDALFRPFKNSGIFKRYLFWRRMSRHMATALVILLILQIYLMSTIVDQASASIKVIGLLFLSLYFLIMLSSWLSIYVQVTFFTELQKYCQTIQHQTVSVQLVNSITCLCLKDYLHFEVKSKVIEEDGKKIKIYSTKGGDEMLRVGDGEQMFERKDLQFDQHLLGKFITFEEFQQQIRAFKDSQAYKACIFWQRSRAALLFLTALISLKLFLDLKAISWLLLLVSLIIYCIIRSKKSKSKSKMVQQLQTFCQNISFEDDRIQVVAYLRENPTKKRCLADEDQLYCFQIRLKDHLHS